MVKWSLKGECVMEAQIIPMNLVEQKIYLVRGHKVMLDRDLAGLYGVETRVLNQAVRRNINRFPEDFMLSLTREEIMNLSQIVISSGIKHAPSVFAFTEQGVAMLSTVLRSERAIDVNISIMRAFVKLREMISSNKDLSRRLDDLENKYDSQFKLVFDAIRQLMAPSDPPKKHKIGFGREGE
jgi:ORF6N domain-containing protein